MLDGFVKQPTEQGMRSLLAAFRTALGRIVWVD